MPRACLVYKPGCGGGQSRRHANARTDGSALAHSNVAPQRSRLGHRAEENGSSA
jgi:hypothetical protein